MVDILVCIYKKKGCFIRNVSNRFITSLLLSICYLLSSYVDSTCEACKEELGNPEDLLRHLDEHILQWPRTMPPLEQYKDYG